VEPDAIGRRRDQGQRPVVPIGLQVDGAAEEVAAEVLVLTGIEKPTPRLAGERGNRPSAWRRTSE
jgi:hypothetical protein